jgi:catechol 2,3-dioxygenase-like lactoylglutathione lyase family enzyme
VEDEMITVGNAQLWVHDQQAALEFYTRKVGFEVRMDVTLAELADFRWLTVGPVS